MACIAARREKQAVGAVVSNRVRQALNQADSAARRGGVVTNEMIDALREDGLD